MMKKILLIICISLFILNSCTKTWSVTYQVISTKQNTIIKYREMKESNYGTKLTETKLSKGTNWSKHIVLKNSNFYPKDKLEFELIVTGEGEGTIFVAFKESHIIDPDYTNIYSLYIASNETTNNYIRLFIKAEEIHL